MDLWRMADFALGVKETLFSDGFFLLPFGITCMHAVDVVGPGGAIGGANPLYYPLSLV